MIGEAEHLHLAELKYVNLLLGSVIIWFTPAAWTKCYLSIIVWLDC